ncbi:MAG TPA: hypothetical protein VFA73_17435 [Actinomycetota bacterium]|nr:hypothetical protein [Actinomycetota bacterium]
MPIVDANPLPGRAERFGAPAPAMPATSAAPSGAGAADLAPPTAPIEPPATVDLRSDGLADPVRHDDDPPVPAGPVTAGEPGRP